MAGEFFLTIPDPKAVRELVRGTCIRGRAEPRLAMVGRSNVGKSSLLNALLGVRVARVSTEPGRTRALQLFFWNEAKKIVVDLPGYGFARVSAGEKEAWSRLIQAYIEADEGLERAVVLLDSRHGPTALDREAIRFLSFQRVPVTFVFTKADELKTQSDRVRRRREASEKLKELGYDPKGAFWVSSRTGDGLKELARDLSGKSASTGME